MLPRRVIGFRRSEFPLLTFPAAEAVSMVKPIRPPMKISLKPIPPSRRRRPGFTLVELLVSIVILAVLATLVVMISGKVRGKAKQASSMNAMRQIAQGNIGFAAENNGSINTLRWVGDPEEGGPGAWVSNSFWGRLEPYLFSDISTRNQKQLGTRIRSGIAQIFNTSDPSKMTGTAVEGAKIYHDGSGLPVPLGFNTNLHKWATFKRVSNFGDPARVIHATYGFGFFTEANGRTFVPMPTNGAAPGGNNIYYMEDRKAWVIFLDGHVETLAAPIPGRLFQ
jgi:prepilin-type N-terminal cleavage/methylation domain-containing protein